VQGHVLKDINCTVLEEHLANRKNKIDQTGREEHLANRRNKINKTSREEHLANRRNKIDQTSGVEHLANRRNKIDQTGGKDHKAAMQAKFICRYPITCMLNFKGGPKVMNIYNHKEQYSVQHINIGSHSYALLRHFHIQESNKKHAAYKIISCWRWRLRRA
jgi:hypothetical protein